MCLKKNLKNKRQQQLQQHQPRNLNFKNVNNNNNNNVNISKNWFVTSWKKFHIEEEEEETFKLSIEP